MILQALTNYYETLLTQGKITPPGWATIRVSYGIELDTEGQVVQLYHLQQEISRGKKQVLVPRAFQMPAKVKKSSNVAANFLCDNSSYMLGVDNKENPSRTVQCFAAAKDLHLRLLSQVSSPAAQAIVQPVADKRMLECLHCVSDGVMMLLKVQGTVFVLFFLSMAMMTAASGSVFGG